MRCILTADLHIHNRHGRLEVYDRVLATLAGGAKP